MWKFYIVTVFIFSGCSNMTFNAQMCNEIARDPLATIPQECVKYNEEEAKKAFENTSKKRESKEDLEFKKE